MTQRELRPERVSVPGLWNTVNETPWAPVLREYEDYLTTIRQLALPTVRNYMNDLTAFMTFLSDNEQIDSITSPGRRQLRS